MVIPNKIKIGGQDISVVNEERIEPNKLGTICMAAGVLKIADNFNNRKQCESSKIKTFIHEVVHGILDTMGEFELSKNEKFVCTFSSLLIDPIEEIIKANNERTAMIIESIKTLRSLCIKGKYRLHTIITKLSLSDFGLNTDDFADMKEGEIREVFLNLED